MFFKKGLAATAHFCNYYKVKGHTDYFLHIPFHNPLVLIQHLHVGGFFTRLGDYNLYSEGPEP